MTPLSVRALISMLFIGALLISTATAAGTANTTLSPAATAPLSFANSKMIWTPTTTPGTHVSLRKDFTPPTGKALIAAEIITSVFAAMDFYVNGEYLGVTPIARTGFANRFCVDLLPSFNVFAVNASSGGVFAGMVATILLTYSDGTTDTILSDGSWRAINGVPAGFEQTSFDDTAWPAATVLGPYGETSLGGAVLVPASPAVVSFGSANWVWTDVAGFGGTLPAGSRAFRKTFTPAPGQIPMTADIIATADNAYTLYVNGVEVGGSNDFHTADHFVVNFQPGTTEVVLAVLATNTAASAAGILLSMEVNMQPSGRTNCTAGAFVVTDAAWKSTKGAIPTGWEQPGFDDSAWPAVGARGGNGVAPWGTVTIDGPSTPVTV